MNINYDYIENYIASYYTPKTGQLKELLSYARDKNIPVVQDNTAMFLEFMCAFKKPAKILEIGTAIGYSAIIMKLAAGEKCHIDTIERDEKMYEKAVKNVSEAGLSDSVKVLMGDARDILKYLDQKYDLIFIDAAKGQYAEFFEVSLGLLNNGGVIMCDNVLFRGTVANAELVSKKHKNMVDKLKSFTDNVMKNQDLVSSILPVGDGVLVSCKRESSV